MMDNINFGIKISIKNFNLIPEIYTNSHIIDFIEIILFEDFSPDHIDFLKNLKLPYVIHVPNSNYGIDFGDINKSNNNINYINKINKYNKELNPLCFVIHPESGDINISLENIQRIKIRPLAIENMPVKGIRGEILLGYDPSTLGVFFRNVKDLDFCFDINHAIKAAITKKIDYLNFIEEFLDFKKPILFHIAGGSLASELDEHHHLETSQYNIAKIKSILKNYNHKINLTFETPRNYKHGIEDDLKNINYFLNI